MVALSEVIVDLVAAQDEARFRALMQAHHSLGALPGIGETVRYVAHHRGRWLALVVFSAPALKCATRERWSGWSFAVQLDRLHLLKFFQPIDDPRRRQGRRHALPTVLALATAATLCASRALDHRGHPSHPRPLLRRGPQPHPLRPRPRRT